MSGKWFMYTHVCLNQCRFFLWLFNVFITVAYNHSFYEKWHMHVYFCYGKYTHALLRYEIVLLTFDYLRHFFHKSLLHHFPLWITFNTLSLYTETKHFLSLITSFSHFLAGGYDGWQWQQGTSVCVFLGLMHKFLEFRLWGPKGAESLVLLKWGPSTFYMMHCALWLL